MYVPTRGLTLAYRSVRTPLAGPGLRYLILSSRVMTSCTSPGNDTNTGAASSTSSSSSSTWANTSTTPEADSSSGSAPCSEVHVGELGVCNQDCADGTVFNIESVRNI